MKRYLPLLLLLLLLAGCGKKHRFDYIDIAASEKTFAELSAQFRSVPDTLPGGRRAFMLSIGKPVADILVFEGESGDPSQIKLPDIPDGYACQTIGREELLKELRIKNGKLFTDGGRNAALLYLQDPVMSVEVLCKIASLAEAGALIGGVKPVRTTDTLQADLFHRTVERVWLSGNVMSGKTLKSVLAAAGVRRDLKTKKKGFEFQHRSLPNADIYYLKNGGDFSGKARLTFRVRGREPLLWNPDTGEITQVGYKLKKRSTKVTIKTVPGDDCFLVFGSFADKPKRKVR